MTGGEMDALLQWMNKRWAPTTGRLDAWANAPDIVSDFANFTFGAAMDALWAWYREGRPGKPNPSQLLAATADQQRRRIGNGTDPPYGETECAGRHTWAHVGGWDVEICTRCGADTPHDPAHCPTCKPNYRPPEQKPLLQPDTF